MNKVYEIVTNKIISIIEKDNILPWRKPWNAGTFLPTNGASMKHYSGINEIMLQYSEKNKSPFWFTFNQAKALGGTVKKGEHGEMVVFFKILSKTVQNGNETTDKSFPFLRYSTVFNLSQIELPEEVMKKYESKTEENTFTPIESAEGIVSGYKTCPAINYGGGRAYYTSLMDYIQMPLKETFENEVSYYGTLFHEIIHSTGNEKRLQRFKNTDSRIFGSETYSKEELVAEIGSAMLLNECGLLDNTIENNASYIKSWLKALKNDASFIVYASSKSSKAVDYILNRNLPEEVTE